ncbi:hypothetical protein BT96DRAFT_889206 [Gymnopus androsaceus JB14]|uniref:Uncharacterized protein n=1 Tax=Gymnopus androsaceus JB14 TaxID=1447944 RepID=A0A6A4GXG5_9AGAR|nr:hypothetical protein BT96DRAFT_889206 [Gymnopus androsaceus JB14]
MSSQALTISAKPSTLASLTNHFRPHRGEALVRLRSNAFGLISIFISTWILPIPSIITAIRIFSSGNDDSSGMDGGAPRDEWSVRKVICVLELGLVTVLAYNILEASYALKYPRKPLPPSNVSPVKKPGPQGVFSPGSAKKPFSIISPSATPTSKSKIFPYSPGQSLASLSQSTQYPASPMSSPSHIIRYSMPGRPSEGTINASISSSTSTMPPTPSPSRTLASAYRGKHASSFNGGRPVDGNFLTQMASSEDEDEE